jgi:hypothetical protein
MNKSEENEGEHGEKVRQQGGKVPRRSGMLEVMRQR